MFTVGCQLQKTHRDEERREEKGSRREGNETQTWIEGNYINTVY